MYHQKETARHLQAFAALALACVVFNTGSAWATDAASSDANDAPTSTTTDTTTPAGTTTADGTGKTENSDNASSAAPSSKNGTDTVTPSATNSNSAGPTLNEGNLIFSAAVVLPSDAGLTINNPGTTTNGGVILGYDAANLGNYPLVLTSSPNNADWQGASASAITNTTAQTTITCQGLGSLTSSSSLYGSNLTTGNVILTNTLVGNTSLNGQFHLTGPSQLNGAFLNSGNNLTIADPYLTLMHSAFKDWPGGSGQAPSDSTTPNNPPAGQPRSYMINIGGVEIAITQMVLITGGKAYYCPPPDPDATGPIVYDVRTLPLYNPLYNLGPAPIGDYNNFAPALSSATPFGTPNSANYLASPTPEPSTLGIVAAGVLGLLRKRRRS